MGTSTRKVIWSLTRHLLTGPSIRVCLVSVLVYGLLILYCKRALWRDPHSAFFNDDHVYELDYSNYRIEEAEKFIQVANKTLESSRDAEGNSKYVDESITGLGKGTGKPVLCAAYVTVRREHKQYLSEAVGSMLTGLSPKERAALNLTILFADTEPTTHPNWKNPWVQNVVDAAQTYTGLTEAQWEEVKGAETEKNYYVKGVLYVSCSLPKVSANMGSCSDYVYALSQCLDNTTAPFIAVFEDDIIFADGWMTRSLLALQEIKKHYSSLQPWLYLRLFYTETALQWEANHDYWYSHLSLTFAVTSSIVAALLIALRLSLPYKLRAHLDTGSIVVLSLVTTPALTALAFLVGKYSIWVPLQNPGSPLVFLGSIGGRRGAGPVSLAPFPLRQAGLVLMNKYGCCTQAMIFPRALVPGLISYLRDRHDGQTDTMIEEYANLEKFNRFALSPQLVQHVGLDSSRGNSLLNAQSTWAFWFEKNDPRELKRKHDRDSRHIDWDALREAE